MSRSKLGAEGRRTADGAARGELGRGPRTAKRPSLPCLPLRMCACVCVRASACKCVQVRICLFLHPRRSSRASSASSVVGAMPMPWPWPWPWKSSLKVWSVRAPNSDLPLVMIPPCASTRINHVDLSRGR
eukprot:scaffold2790_cov239-Pinguiococcus_pyrenoidosus.AAC.13